MSLRDFAAEAEMWTSLAINVWLLLGAMGLVAIRLVTKKPIDLDKVGAGLLASFMILVGLGIVFFVANGIYQRFLVGFWDGVVLAFVIAFFTFFLIVGYLAERNSK